MLSEKELQSIGMNEMMKVFDRAYLEKNLDHSVLAAGHCNDNLYQYFVGFKTENERPEIQADDHGWTVYALVYIDETTGEVKKFTYQTDIKE